MADYNTATVDHPTFQQNTPSGRGWRKRYAKENGGGWVNTDGNWDWSGSVRNVVPKPVAFKSVAVVDELEVEEEEE